MHVQLRSWKFTVIDPERNRNFLRRNIFLRPINSHTSELLGDVWGEITVGRQATVWEAFDNFIHAK